MARSAATYRGARRAAKAYRSPWPDLTAAQPGTGQRLVGKDAGGNRLEATIVRGLPRGVSALGEPISPN